MCNICGDLLASMEYNILGVGKEINSPMCYDFFTILKSICNARIDILVYVKSE